MHSLSLGEPLHLMHSEGNWLVLIFYLPLEEDKDEILEEDGIIAALVLALSHAQTTDKPASRVRGAISKATATT